MHRNPISEESLTDENAVLEGLMRKEKYISSYFLYDREGSRLFQRIMKMPEYYLYEAEFEILSEKGDEIRQALPFYKKPYKVIELGAGDGSKTVELLRHLMKNESFKGYFPIDISSEATQELSIRLAKEIPHLEVNPIHGNYDEELARLIPPDEWVLLLFLGSNIGNFTSGRMRKLMKGFGKDLKSGDAILIGFDLKKHPRLIQKAYDDVQGITRAFNLNLLARFNREFGADFQSDQFDFYSTYDPVSGEVRSYLVSLINQEVHFLSAGRKVTFEKNELIHTETSKKFDVEEIEKLFLDSGFFDLQIWKDHNDYYADVLAVRR